MDEQRKPPVKEIRLGSAAVTVWQNDYRRDGRDEFFLSATVNKKYLDKQGGWRKSGSFTKRELEDAAKAIQEALTFMEIHEHKERVRRHAAPQ